jgi:hypothetical protein
MPKLPIPKARAVLLAASLTALFFMACGASLWHVDAPGSEANCPICHFAHMPLLPRVSTSLPIAPATVVWILPAETYEPYTAPTALHSSPRAPPA